MSQGLSPVHPSPLPELHWGWGFQPDGGQNEGVGSTGGCAAEG